MSSSSTAWQVRRSLLSSSRSAEIAFIAIVSLLAFVGLLGIAPVLLALWNLWTSDALRSMGMLFPVISLALTLRVWKSMRWQADGTWWGLVVMVAAAAAAYAGGRFLLYVHVRSTDIALLPHNALVLYAYASGVVLLLGGARLWRAAAFPLLLLLFVNPFPIQFSQWFDLPLQRISAQVVWAFAAAIGLRPDVSQLRLMFSPDFGMFIAPGCNGIRGSLTMGYFALILGYLNNFRRRVLALAVVAAIALGYLFNLARLCVLVLYYKVAMHYPALQDKALGADTIIGSCLFFIALILFSSAVRAYRRQPPANFALAANDPAESEAPLLISIGASWWTKAASVACFAIFGFAVYAHALAAPRAGELPPVLNSTADAPPGFPYLVSRTWNEQYLGHLLYDWVDYTPTSAAGQHSGNVVHVGMAPDNAWHNTIVCHSTRGESPAWTGTLRASTADGNPVSFQTAFYDNGATRVLEANTQCDAAGCDESMNTAGPLQLAFSTLRMSANGGQRLSPVLVKIESTDTTTSADAVRDQMAGDLKNFVSRADLALFTRRPMPHKP